MIHTKERCNLNNLNSYKFCINNTSKKIKIKKINAYRGRKILRRKYYSI